MAITLNGTTGITTPDITSDSYTGPLNVSASAPDNSLVVDSAGNVGIGTSSPTNKLHVVGSVKFEGSVLDLNDPGTFTISQNSSASALVLRTATSSYMRFDTNGANERMRLDSSGNLLVGTTSQLGSGSVSVDTSANGITARTTGTTNNYSAFVGARNGNDGRVAEWYQNLASSRVGSISITASSTAYNTSSDYRLKEDWQPMTGASERVQALKPVNFAWKVDGSRVDGFLAHEAQEVVPECVSGGKDAMRTEEYEVTPAVLDNDGNIATEAVMGEREVPEYQGIDQSKLVPLLTAALQEALTKIDALTARIEALEQV